MLERTKKELAKLKKKYPQHKWIYENYFVSCEVCHCASLTPWGECVPWEKQLEQLKARREKNKGGNK